MRAYGLIVEQGKACIDLLMNESNGTWLHMFVGLLTLFIILTQNLSILSIIEQPLVSSYKFAL